MDFFSIKEYDTYTKKWLKFFTRLKGFVWMTSAARGIAFFPGS